MLDRVPTEVRLGSQIFWCILIFSRSPSLAHVCKRLRQLCTFTPIHIRTRYLLSCWLESYSLRFTGGLVVDTNIPSFAPKFVPTTYPPSGIQQKRTATADILSFVSRYGICTAAQLAAVEREVINAEMFGNICQLHGIFHIENGCFPYKPVSLSCHTVPERLVRAMKPWNTAELEGLPMPQRDSLLRVYQLINDMPPQDMPAGVSPLPSFDKLELLLRLILIHHASPNSNQGFLLAMAVYAESTPLICFMLACGADPMLRNGIALHISVKKGWIRGLRLLVERDDRVEAHWRTILRQITHELHNLSQIRCGNVTKTPHRHLGSNKRRRLADRCQVDVSLLNAAVRSKAWDLVNYLMNQKGLVPDVDTLNLIDQHGGSI